MSNSPPTPSETGTIHTNGIETYYVRRGEGPPIVFIHGAVMDQSQWTPQLEALDDEFTVYAYDIRGHGRTGGSDCSAYSIELYAADLDAFLTELGIEQPILCGLSMGGAIAQMYAASHPDAISGLILADTFSPELTTRRDRLLMASLKANVLPVKLFGYPRVSRFNTWVHELFNPGSGGEYDRVAELMAEAPQISTAEFAKVMRALSAFPNATVDLSAITAPTTVIYGENEPGMMRRQALKLAAEIPNSTLQEIPGAGHASNLDKPELFTDAVRALAERAARASEK